jgi:hypothetical protein
VAAALALAGSTALAAAESVPGRPLFGLRLAVEQALLPAQSPVDRLEAQLVRLDLRLNEATDVSPDADAASEAIRAYRATLPEVPGLLRQAPSHAPSVRQSRMRQLGTIRALTARLPAQTRPELDRAADEARALLATIQDNDGRPACCHGNHRGGSSDRDR